MVPQSTLVGKDWLMTSPGVIDADYKGEVKIVLANREDQPYQVEKADKIAKLIIEKNDNRERQEVAHLDDPNWGDQGFGNYNTTMDQRVNGQSAKPAMEIN